MKKRSLIFILILAVLNTAFGIILLDQRMAPPWQVRLNQYLAYLRERGITSPQVVSIAHAMSPINFSPGMSSETYSPNVSFQTARSQGRDFAADHQTLPYPPEEVMCVLLEVDGQNELVYVALHSNLNNNDWIVHISPEPWGSPVLQSHLSSLGCSLDTRSWSAE